MAKQNTPKANNVIVQNITVKSNPRQTQDIKKWRDAIKAADSLTNPNRKLLYQLYEDILLDGHLTSVVQKRQFNITNKDLVFERDGAEDEEISKLLNSPDIERLLTDLIDTRFWGYTVIQVNSIYWDENEEQYKIDYDLIPRIHVHPERDFQCISKGDGQASKDFMFKEPPLANYMLWAGNSKDYGLLMKAAQYAIYKRGDFGDWAQFAELFGMPFREARYDEYDEATRIELEKMLDQYGGAGYAILPKKAEFTLHQATTAASSNVVYKDLKDSCNQEMSVVILGQTLTTTQGENGARSLGEVHQESEDDIMNADMRFIRNILNGKFKAILKTFGFNVTGGKIDFLEKSNIDKLQKKAAFLSSAEKLVPLDDDYKYQELGIPKPANYEQLKTERTAAATAAQKPNDQQQLPGKPQNWLQRFFD